MIMKFLGPNIESLRKSLGMTQEKVAHDADISTRALQRIESGKANPKIGTLEKIAHGMGASIDCSIMEKTKEQNPATRAMLQTIWVSWKGAPTEAKALCLFALQPKKVEYLSLLTEEQRVKVLAAARVLGLDLPKGIS